MKDPLKRVLLYLSARNVHGNSATLAHQALCSLGVHDWRHEAPGLGDDSPATCCWCQTGNKAEQERRARLFPLTPMVEGITHAYLRGAEAIRFRIEKPREGPSPGYVVDYDWLRRAECDPCGAEAVELDTCESCGAQICGDCIFSHAGACEAKASGTIEPANRVS